PRRALASPIATIEPRAPSPAGRATGVSPRPSEGDRAGLHGRLRRASHEGSGDGRDASNAAERASGRAGREGRTGPRSGHAALAALRAGGTGDRDDSGGDAASRGPATRKAIRDTRG